MKTTVGELRSTIKSVILEIGNPTGRLRGVRTGGGRQYKIGKTDDENRELSAIEAEREFPGSTEAWAEIVPLDYPEYPFKDPRVIKSRSVWFRIGGELRVAFEENPQMELMKWSPSRQDWFDIDEDEADPLKIA